MSYTINFSVERDEKKNSHCIMDRFILDVFLNVKITRFTSHFLPSLKKKLYM